MADHSRAVGTALITIGKALTELGYNFLGTSQPVMVSYEKESIEVEAPQARPTQASEPVTPAQETAKSSVSVDAPKDLKTADLEGASRDQLKMWADSYGLATAGKKASELRAMLAEAIKVTGEQTTEATEGDVEAMKEDLELFIWLNRDVLEESGFFGAPSNDPENPTYDEIMASDKLIREAWMDNVQPAIQSGEWEAMKVKAQATFPQTVA